MLIKVRPPDEGGVKLSRNRQAAAESSGNGNSLFFIRISISIRIFPLKPAKDDDSADRLQFGHRSNELDNRQTEIRLLLNLTRPQMRRCLDKDCPVGPFLPADRPGPGGLKGRGTLDEPRRRKHHRPHRGRSAWFERRDASFVSAGNLRFPACSQNAPRSADIAGRRPANGQNPADSGTITRERRSLERQRVPGVERAEGFLDSSIRIWTLPAERRGVPFSIDF